MINDDNTLSDITGLIGSAQIDLSSSNPEFDPGRQILEIIERIELKLHRIKNKTKANWFKGALEYAQTANALWVNEPLKAIEQLDRCKETLESGNKAHRRKTAFIVGPNGEVESTTKKCT